jgi:predicted extracellular nuclease
MANPRISLTNGTPYTQNFNTLSNTAASTTNAQSTAATSVPGWPDGWEFNEIGGGARDNEQYAVDTGSLATGDTISFGAAGSTDRALGQIRSGTLISTFGASFTNDSGAAITSLDIAYVGEQWRVGGAHSTVADKMDFQISFNATGVGDTAATWIDVNQLDFNAPVTATTSGALDGNLAANRTALSFTLAGLNIPAGTSFFIRWTDVDATGSDDGLAIDDFSITAHTAAVVTPTLTIADVSHSEGDAGTVTYTFTVSLDAPAPAGGVTFNIATADGTATSASGDYVARALDGQTIPAGSTSYTFDVTVNSDRAIESDESFFVNVTNVTGATVGDGQAAAMIVNDDTAPALSIDDVSKTETDDGTVTYTFTVSLDHAARTGGVSFDIATADGTATTADGDYAGRTLTSQTIPEGETTYTFDVTVNGDTKLESNETFSVNVTNVTGATVTDGQGTGTIVENDTPPTLTIADVAQNEGHTGTTTYTFTVSLDHAAPAGGVTFDIATSDGTATAGSDYVARTLTTQTIPAGSTSYTFDVTVNGDRAIEPNETFNVSVSNVTGAVVGDGTATGTITNDDVAPQVSIGDATVVEGNKGVSYLTFTVSLDHPAADAVSVDWTTANGTALSGSDYLATGGSITFAPGETSKTVAVPVIGDSVAEANETLTVTLSNVSGGTIADGSGAGTIVNDDLVNYFSLASGNFSENWTDTSRISVNDDWSKVGSILGYLGDIDTAGAVTGVDPRTLTGASIGQIDVIANLNTTTSTSGGVGEFQLANPTIGLQGSGTADAPSIVLYMDASGRSDIHLTANIRDIDTTADNAAQQVAVQYRTSPGADWSNVPGGYIADATTGGSATQVTALDIHLPADADNAPTLEIRILTTNAAGNDEWVGIDDIVVSSSQASTPSYAISDATSFEGTCAEATPISFTVTRVGDASAAGAVDYAVTFPGGGFSADASDFTSALSGSVSFAAGESSKTITLNVVADSNPEADEGFTVTLANPSSGTIGHPTATGTIVNDDGAPPFVAISDVTQAEGDTGTTTFTFTVSRTGGTGAFTVDYATADGTATAGSDYAETHGTLSFAAGENAKTISVTVNGDTAGELTEKFSVNLSHPTGFAVLADATGTGTISNDDVIPIYQIQGSGHSSPLVGEVVKTQGIVTAIASNGYYIQDAQGDGNTATSDAVFVFTGVAPTGAALGDLVQVSGTVTEFVAGAGALSVTEVSTSGAPIVLSTGNDLPAATLIGEGGRIPPTENGPGNGFGNALDFYESMEGMRVTVHAPQVVADTNSFGETWVVAGGAATGLNDRGGVTISAGDTNPERIQLDDDSTIFNGYTPQHTTGDVLADVTGIMNYSHSSYEVLVTAPVTVTNDVTLGQETTEIAGDADHLSIASYNIENADVGDGQQKFDLLAGNIVNNLLAPDIVALQEVQDADGPGAGTDLSGTVTAQKLIDAIKAIGGPNYVYIEVAPTANNQTGGEPNGNIRPGFLYNADRVTYIDGSAHIIDDSAFSGSRRPLVADFLFNGKKIELIDVHFTSRLGSTELQGSTQPPIDAGDNSRTAQGRAVAAYISTALATDPALKLGVMGDFNGFYFEGAVGAIEAKGLTDLHRTLPSEERYSYLFDGNSQAIDHIIVTPNLFSSAQFDAVHLNSQFPNNATRPTDHDPVVASFAISALVLDLNGEDNGTNASNSVVEQDATATFISQSVSVSDGQASFDGGKLTVAITTNGQAGDILGVHDTEAVSFVDGKVYYGETQIGTVSGGGDALTPIVVTFNANATAAGVEATARAITFEHDADVTSGGARNVHYTLTDNDGGSTSADATVTVQPANDAPSLTAPTQSSVTFTEGDPSVAILQGVTLSDPDAPASFVGGSLALDVDGTPGGLNLRTGSNFVINDNEDGSFTLAIVVTGTQIAFGTISGFGTPHLTVTDLTSAATLDRVNDLIDDFTFVKAGDDVHSADATITVTFNDGNNTGNYFDEALTATQTQNLTVVGTNDAPIVDLNGSDPGTGSAITFTEGDSAHALAAGASVVDPDAPETFENGVLSVSIAGGASDGDQLLILAGQQHFNVSEGVLYKDEIEIGTVSGGLDQPLVITFNASATPAIVQSLVQSIGFANTSNTPLEGDRHITFTLSDGQGGTSDPATATVTVHGVVVPPTGVADHVYVSEDSAGTGNVFADNGNGPDQSPDAPLQVEAVNGNTAAVGQTITLASGALLTVNADGSYTFDPNHAYDYLVDSGTNAANSHATETFTYTLKGASEETTVTVTINGVSAPGEKLSGTSGNDTITGTNAGELIDLSQGGNDTVFGQEGNDGFYFGAALTAADRVDGGGGADDQLAIQGDYALTLGNVVGVETLAILSGHDGRFGDTGGNDYDYDITTVDGNVAAGQNFIVNANELGADESLVFDGSAETNGTFRIYAGFGHVDLTGGAGSDGFFFGEGRFNVGDRIDGGAGKDDQLALRGDYGRQMVFEADTIHNIDTIVVLTAHGVAGAEAPAYSYNLKTDDANLAAAQKLVVTGVGLAADEHLIFDGSAETDGHFDLRGGAGSDTLIGGHQSDSLYGGLGADQLTGGAGNDTFLFRSTGDSTAANQDGILDFATGDLIDLSAIDADTTSPFSNDAFHFIGSDAFGNHAGELRVDAISGSDWLVQGDVDGDGVADFQLLVTVTDNHPLAATDFNF